jgi:hypothetical protein
MYLELGKRTPGHLRRNSTLGNSIGDVTVYAGFGWLIERNMEPIVTSEASAVQCKALIERLKGATIASIALTSNDKELDIAFSTSDRLFTKRSDSSDPEWSVTFNAPPMGHLSVAKGVVRHEHGYS